MLTSLKILRDRAHMLAEARKFFALRKVIEVDCPLLPPYASVDAHIDLIPTQPKGEVRYLHSSPEYAMKRLLVDGVGDIYQLGHVFRDGEQSHKHQPEFTMAEWYRLNISFQQMIEETVDFIRLFVGQLPFSTISYRDLFKRYARIDYLTASSQELVQYLESHAITPYPSVIEEGKDALLNLILGTLIEPQLGKGELLVLSYYPASQSALARTAQHGDETVCERFEVYFKGYELANGYHELADPIEQRRRLNEANAMRVQLGKETLPIDEPFLAALEKGLPDCCGVAVGFDRLMMLRHQTDQIAQILPFPWNPEFSLPQSHRVYREE